MAFEQCVRIVLKLPGGMASVLSMSCPWFSLSDLREGAKVSYEVGRTVEKKSAENLRVG